MTLTTLISRVACPYCYHRVDRRRLWFQCTGRGSPGRAGCAMVADPERTRETGFRDAARPAFGPPGRGPFSPARADCPNCGGNTGIRACPCCHTPVSANFGSSASPLIAMVGATGTGKTVYLNVLGHELLNGMRRRFDADVRTAGATPDDLFRSQALFAAQTEAANEGRREPMVFEWRRQRRVAGVIDRFQTTYLSFYDTAGEDLTRQDSTYDLAYLGAADALILLLDPFMIPHARNQIRLPESALRSKESTVAVVNRITEALRSSHGVKSQRTIRIPVAVAFAKIDAFFEVLGADHPLVRRPNSLAFYDELAGRQTHEHVRAVLHDWDADDIDTHLRFNYANFRYFAVSALGEQPDYDNFVVDARGIQPFRVDEPLVWLLSRFGVVPSAGSR